MEAGIVERDVFDDGQFVFDVDVDMIGRFVSIGVILAERIRNLLLLLDVVDVLIAVVGIIIVNSFLFDLYFSDLLSLYRFVL